jgi:hypothetical protein
MNLKRFGSLLLVVILQVVSILAYAQNSELRGICKLNNTSDKCLVINKSSSTLVQVSWLLAGSHVDYVNDALVNLKPGKSIMVSNEPGRDNCLFTEDTSVTVYTRNGQAKDFHQQLRFDSNGNCSLVVK